MYVYTYKIHIHTYWLGIPYLYIYVLCTYYTYKIRAPLLIKYDNVLLSLKEREERSFFLVQKSGSVINFWPAVGPALSSFASGTCAV